MNKYDLTVVNLLCIYCSSLNSRRQETKTTHLQRPNILHPVSSLTKNYFQQPQLMLTEEDGEKM